MKGQHLIVLRKLFVAKDAGWVVRQKKKLFAVTCPKTFGSVVWHFILFFNLAVIMLHQHRFCIYKDKKNKKSENH